jgi:hypothetical protein
LSKQFNLSFAARFIVAPEKTIFPPKRPARLRL